MSYVDLLVGFVAGVIACALYNLYFSSKFTKLGQDIMAEIAKLKAKL